jgi:hypothetical protein
MCRNSFGSGVKRGLEMCRAVCKGELSQAASIGLPDFGTSHSVCLFLNVEIASHVVAI